MINLIDGFKIKATSNCYEVGKDHDEKNKETGEIKTIFKAMTFYTTFSGAMKGARRLLHREALKSFDGSLQEAVAVIRSLDERFNALIENIDC